MDRYLKSNGLQQQMHIQPKSRFARLFLLQEKSARYIFINKKAVERGSLHRFGRNNSCRFGDRSEFFILLKKPSWKG